MTWPDQRRTPSRAVRLYLLAITAGVVLSIGVPPQPPPAEAQTALSAWSGESDVVLAPKFEPARQRTRTQPDRHRRARPEKPLYVLPIDRSLVTPADLARPHHDYSAWDGGLPYGTPIHSIERGYVTRTFGSGACGIGVEVRGVGGSLATYCHGSATHVVAGTYVEAGDVIMSSGNTGHSTGPHLHLEITNPAGALLCPQPLLLSWYSGGEMAPVSAPSTGCSYATADPEPPISGVVVDPDIPSGEPTPVTTFGTATPTPTPVVTTTTAPTAEPAPSPTSE
jgi:murein DD-endopeptidase MepM/ murein hydrolase activator NlpD